MRSSITSKDRSCYRLGDVRLFTVIAVVLLLSLPKPVTAQRISILDPNVSDLSAKYSEAISDSLRSNFKINDPSMDLAAFGSLNIETPFNLTTIKSLEIGRVLGCDYFVLIKTGTQRRVSPELKDYFEAFAAIYLVSSRTGELVFWNLKSFPAESEPAAKRLLLSGASEPINTLSEKLRTIFRSELTKASKEKIGEMPADGSSQSAGFRPPMPYKRVKPEYTSIAYLYDIQATVEIEADIAANGSIIETRVVRWAGYGLDESVTEAVRKMSWRPAEINGKSLPMRVLLRYNFAKLDK
ncbi:MAG: energy transducer TonB [Blastocatellia bacterium]